MRHTLAAVCFCLAWLAIVEAQAPYTNPVIPRPGQHSEVADPFVLKWNGEFYLYTSGDPITAYHSTDLVNWTFIGPVLSSSSEPGAWNGADVWAPEVVYRNGRFYMYYTASQRSPDWRIGEMARRLGVAVSDSPRGPFIDMGRPLTPGWAIDGHVFKDPDTGEEFLFYSYLYEPRLPGAGIVVDRLERWDRVAGAPSHVTRGTDAWEDKDGDPNDGTLRYTNEAPTVVKRGGRYYMMYSGGSWDLPTYSMAYAVSDEVMQGGLDGPGWRKVLPPILRSTPLVDAPGHNALVKAPNNFDDIVLYHARPVPFLHPGTRLPFADRLYWHHDRLFIEPPSRGHRPPPDRPQFSDLFNRANGPLGTAWRTSGGEGTVVDGRARLSAAPGSTAVAVPQTAPRRAHVFEANLRFDQPAAGALAGVAPFVDGSDRIEVLIDCARRALVTRGRLGEAEVPEETAPLPGDFDCAAFHQILTTRNEDRIAIDLDGVRVQQRTFPFGGRAAGVALLASGATVEFDGVALTAAFEDTFDAPAQGWTVLSGTWLTNEGIFQQVAGGQVRAIAVKGDAETRYELSASVRWVEGNSIDATAGIVAAADADGGLVLAGFNRDLWPFSRFIVRHLTAKGERSRIAVEMPRGFRYDEFHALRVLRQDDAFTFFLDGAPVAAARIAIGPSRPGLYTEGVRADFDDVRVKRPEVRHNVLLDGGFESEQWEGAKPAHDNVWQFSGAARVNACCAHSGGRRLLITGGEGEARQVVSGLAPGSYVLHAFVRSRGAAAPRVFVEGASIRAQPSGPAPGEWTLVTVPFTVSGRGPVTVGISARPRPEADDYAAADDFYLVEAAQ
ncbi:MAG TPA: family 43 glycosylhydrolase [Vicinamibacterales bacterium]|nr:family 43 glycosylhydrolase [Vicinamibacterales bacterium]